MRFFRRHNTEEAPADVILDEPVPTDEVAGFELAEVSDHTSEKVASHLGSLAGSVVKVVDAETGITEHRLQIGDELIPISPEEKAEIEAVSDAWRKAANQPELPPDGSGPAA